jgi:hypothetical protein
VKLIDRKARVAKANWIVQPSPSETKR